MGSKDDWMQTYTAGRLDPMDPKPEQIRIVDMAHAQAQICRFGGHTKKFYSVAQHAVLVSSILPPPFKLQGLLHDATEAYLGDIIRPIKRLLPEYAKAEHRLEQMIASIFGEEWPWPQEVRDADNLILATERRDVLAGWVDGWSESIEALTPLPTYIKIWSPELAEYEWLTALQDLLLPGRVGIDRINECREVRGESYLRFKESRQCNTFGVGGI